MSNARLALDADLLAELLCELAKRGQGRRESGAFLLTDRAQPPDLRPQPVTAVAFYDDLDPHCLTGDITFGAAGYTALNHRCRRDGLRVIADIHTHPYELVRQSATDARHPMVALDGHVALIAPHYAAGVTSVTQLGVHERCGSSWTSFYGPHAAQVVQIRPDHSRTPQPRWWRHLLSLANRWRRPPETR
jgi:proteasome lid subunit RPN8/RPN11